MGSSIPSNEQTISPGSHFKIEHLYGKDNYTCTHTFWRELELPCVCKSGQHNVSMCATHIYARGYVCLSVNVGYVYMFCGRVRLDLSATWC